MSKNTNANWKIIDRWDVEDSANGAEDMIVTNGARTVLLAICENIANAAR